MHEPTPSVAAVTTAMNAGPRRLAECRLARITGTAAAAVIAAMDDGMANPLEVSTAGSCGGRGRPIMPLAYSVRPMATTAATGAATAGRQERSCHPTRKL